MSKSRTQKLIFLGFAVLLILTVATNIRHAIRLTLSSSTTTTTLINDDPPPRNPPPKHPSKTQEPNPKSLLVHPTDSIYLVNNHHTRWDVSPIVLEEFKLVFFPTPPATTLWKRLFRRMQGHDDWQSFKEVYNPATNGFSYLFAYNLTQASHFMTRPDFTRAIFLRDPKERFYTLYKDSIENNNGQILIQQCCPRTKDCLPRVTPEYVLDLIRTCHDPRWAPQTDRIEDKYWPYMNFVGYWDTIQQDSSQLLVQQLGIANLFANDGFGPDGKLSFQQQLSLIYQPKQRQAQMQQFYNCPQKALERLVEEVYRKDYDNPVFGFQRAPIVEPTDTIYFKDTNKWDASPIVVEEYKLIFFTVPKVACTTFKFLFRRMRGLEDWNVQDGKTLLPHNPAKNQLTYLWDYNIEKANELMTDPTWTRAVFVRDPKERFLSAFLDKALTNPDFMQRKCCPLEAMTATMSSSSSSSCVQDAMTLVGFWHLIQSCHNDHWSPQHYRMERKYWPYINFVGHFESLEQDANRLLQRIGAWDSYGKTGWGSNGASGIFQRQTNTQTHVTHANTQASTWFTPQLERLVEQYYAVDYANPKLGFVNTNLSMATTAL